MDPFLVGPNLTFLFHVSDNDFCVFFFASSARTGSNPPTCDPKPAGKNTKEKKKQIRKEKRELSEIGLLSLSRPSLQATQAAWG